MRNLPKFSINNYQFVIIVFVVLLLWGTRAFITMPRTEDPPIAVPGAIITVVYPGATPNDMEELIVDKIEEKVNELEDIDEIRSTAGDGFTMINVTFDYGNYDFDDKYNDVVQQVNLIKADLPDDIKSISFRKKTTTDTKILQLALSSETAEYDAMENTAESLEQKLEQIPGILAAEITAVPEKQVKVEMNTDKMVNMGIGMDDISNAINANNQNIPGGEVVIGQNSFNVKTSGSFNSLDEVKNTVVGSVKGQLIYLKDVANVRMDYESNKYLANYNGKRSIFITAEQKQKTNVLEIADEAHAVIVKFKEQLPDGMELNYVHDQSISVKDSVNGFIMNLLQGIILVGIVIMFAIGIRSSIIIMIAIPSSILIGLGFVDLAGFGLQNVSIAALVIALGLLVDNSIVVIENAERLMNNGYGRKKAAIEGTKQVAYPIISSTLTTLAAFIPIAMLPDAAGDYIESLPVTVIATLTASVILALTVSPLLMSKIVKEPQAGEKKVQPIQRVLNRFIEGPYRKALNYSLTHTRIVLIVTVSVFLSSLVVFKLFVGSSFFPKAEKPMFLIQATLPLGKSIEETEKTARYIESVLDTIPQINRYSGNIGHGNPKVYFNTFPKEYNKNYAEYYVVLNEYEADEFKQLVSELRETFSHYVGADVLIKEFQQGQPIQYPIEIVVTGDNINDLQKVSEDFEAILKKQEGVINVNNEMESLRTDLRVVINKDKASMLGVPVSTIDKTIRAALNGMKISEYRTGEGDVYDMVLSLPVDDKAHMEDFDKIYVKSLSGSQIPLSQLARIDFVSSPSKIMHFNMHRNATIGSDVASGYNTAEVTQIVANELAIYKLPHGIEYKLKGESEKQESTFGGLGAAAGIALLIIIAILVLQFRSFAQPFIILTAIPLALTGSFFTLFITGYDFSFTAFIGAVALIGIAINNAIILIDFTNEARKEGKTIFDALMEAGQVRFIPIIITSFTTIGGLLPLTLQGGAFWGPLGWTIIGGLMLSAFLVLLVIPVLYKLFIKKDQPNNNK